MNLNITNSKFTKLLTMGFLMVAFSTFFASCSDDDNPVNPEPEPTIVEIAQSNEDFETLVSALGDAGLVGTLNSEGTFTVFAPTDAAFAELPDGLVGSLTTEQLTQILTYHVLGTEVASGDLQTKQSVETLAGELLFITVNQGVEVNDEATVVTADIQASNGIIHVVDDVLLPDAYLDIVGIAQKRYTLKTLVGAAAQAGLVETLKANTDNGYTLFAPTNEAFAALPEGTLESLSKEQLQNILTYHVLPTSVLSGEITAGTVTTVSGETLEINVTADGTVTLTDQAGNTYEVIKTDLNGTNGVIHLINGVLLPGS